jgi:hypothetical protein
MRQGMFMLVDSLGPWGEPGRPKMTTHYAIVTLNQPEKNKNNNIIK